MGADSAYIVASHDKKYIPIFKVENVIDRTGARDQFAASFLYAYIKKSRRFWQIRGPKGVSNHTETWRKTLN